jgi:hypothetical protein
LPEVAAAPARLKHHLRDDDQVRARADCRQRVAAIEQAGLARLDHRQRDSTATRILAQNEIERIEFATRGNDVRRRVIGVEHCAQSLAGAGLGNDAIGAKRAEQHRQPGTVGADFGAPCGPCLADVRIPGGQCFVHIVSRRIERPAE